MKQYNAIKAKYPGALLLFRVGDFYETFGEDAVKASKILDITLTKRANGAASEIALAGFPYHALDNYLPKLVRAGQRVAICDQLEDPKGVKGIVKRGVTELVTPGISINDNVLETRRNNYLCSLHFSKDLVGIAFLDISTGEFMTAQGNLQHAQKLVQSFAPSEVICSKAQKQQFFDHFGDNYNYYCLDEWVYAHEYGYGKLTDHFATANLKGFGIEEMELAVTASGAIMHYLAETEHRDIAHIGNISRIEEERFVWLDRFSIRNLELVHAQHEGGVPLIQILDHTLTPMGSRMLKKWTVLPLKDLAQIKERQSMVQTLMQHDGLMADLSGHLRQIGDLERMAGKVAFRRINPRELVQLKRALGHMPQIKKMLVATGQPQMVKLADRINECAFLYEKIERELKPEPPMNPTQGGVIREGIDPDLDELRGLAYSGKDHLLQIQQREQKATGITSLKVAYNKVFGYYLEVSNAHKDKVPGEWIRKQTLVNAERYITEELKTYEEKILSAEDKLLVIEQRIYGELVLAAADYVNQIQENAGIIATLDCVASFAHTAKQHRYVRPEVNDGSEINIKGGRHPVIEQQLPLGEKYIPNDVLLNDDVQQIMMITGPNMAGKSALLRQVALIVLMAQMGSFVPAESAELGIIDKVFTRVGASDNLSKGESTFMVEMTETASILNNLSGRSLVLMDEIGRGTSTYDGVSIAWAIVEHLHNHPRYRAKTLFATHYHELNQLTEDFPRIKNFNVSVKEVGDRVIFMRKLKEGGSNHSFGIHVAQMAGMPNPVVLRASEIMLHLEKDKLSKRQAERYARVPKNNFQLSLFEANDPRLKAAKELLDRIDINTISPVEALLKLNEVKGLMGEKEEEVKS